MNVVQDLLNDAELREFERVGDAWAIVFSVGGEERTARLLPGKTYYLLVSIPAQRPMSLESMGAPLLRNILRAQSKATLARIDFIHIPSDDGPESEIGFFVAASECSLEGATGLKIRRRLEACALLAAEIENVLKSSSDTPPATSS